MQNRREVLFEGFATKEDLERLHGGLVLRLDAPGAGMGLRSGRLSGGRGRCPGWLATW